MTRVAVLDDYHHRAHQFADWGALGPDVEVSFFHEPMSEETLVSALEPFDILVLMRERTALPRRVLERLGRLRFVVTTGANNAGVDLAYLHERGIDMSATVGYGSTATPGVTGPVELTWALIFAIAKRVTIEDRALREGIWQTGFPINIGGMTLGLAGLGRLGAKMVGPAEAFGLRVIAWSENLTDEHAESLGATRVSKETLLRESDIVSIHLLLSERTRGLFAAPELAMMKPSAMLINTSRGPIVDEAAMLDALRNGTIAAAGLDVYDVEPLPRDHPLLALDNVVLAPHLGYVSEQTFRGWYTAAIENIAAFLKGAPIRLVA